MADSVKIAYVFPGQGAQSVGMGRDLYQAFKSAKDVFDSADESLGFSLSRLCFDGPEDELRQTINAQPAIVTASFACLEACREAGVALPPADFVAGHSLGEYTALAAAGVLDFGHTVYLARERGRLMHAAGRTNPGAMAAIIGLDGLPLDELCAETGTQIANINSPGQIVISGPEAGINRAVELAKSKGAHRAIPLQVSGAFHTPLMQSAVDGMAGIIDTMEFNDPAVPIIGNTTARLLTTAKAVKEELLDQLCNCVRWQESVENMVAAGVGTFIEIGPGKVLAGLIKRIDRSVKIINIGDAEAVRNFSVD
ncbi:MAG: ACP S-malonyltransferase [Dehalococcoidia bacterium]